MLKISFVICLNNNNFCESSLSDFYDYVSNFCCKEEYVFVASEVIAKKIETTSNKKIVVKNFSNLIEAQNIGINNCSGDLAIVIDPLHCDYKTVIEKFVNDYQRGVELIQIKKPKNFFTKICMFFSKLILKIFGSNNYKNVCLHTFGISSNYYNYFSIDYGGYLRNFEQNGNIKNNIYEIKYSGNSVKFNLFKNKLFITFFISIITILLFLIINLLFIFNLFKIAGNIDLYGILYLCFNLFSLFLIIIFYHNYKFYLYAGNSLYKLK